MKELSDLALNYDAVSDLSNKLFLRLRKTLGSAELVDYLLAVQSLAHSGELAGARLLAAYLDVSTPGARLIPFVRGFLNTRRQLLFLADHPEVLHDETRQWQTQAKILQDQCRCYLNEKNIDLDFSSEKNLISMQGTLEHLLAAVIGGQQVPQNHRELLVKLLQLETDAWQERVSRLAGGVNPYRVAAVQRVLPLLSRADSDIRDMRQLIAWVAEDQDRMAFVRNGFRALEVLEDKEFETLYRTLRSESSLRTLAEIHRGGRDNPLVLGRLGQAVARILALDNQLVLQKWSGEPMDLLSAVVAVQQFTRGQGMGIPLDLEQEAILQKVLGSWQESEDGEPGPASWSQQGISLAAGQLLIDLGNSAEEPMVWPNGLPTTEDYDPTLPQKSGGSEGEDGAENKDDMDASAVKHLVLSNIMSVSLVLGFLRNPKIVAIPGLVAAVATRTRNPQIIETIVTDRTLHSGFANRDVPMVCLRSPCNVSPKLLRRFIHVKFVSKVDLKRMAKDRAGIRKEVAGEINRYLSSLA